MPVQAPLIDANTLHQLLYVDLEPKENVANNYGTSVYTIDLLLAKYQFDPPYDNVTPMFVYVHSNSSFAIANAAFLTANAAFAQANIANANFTAANVLTLLETVDGSGSGLDSDTVDGLHATSFANATFANTYFASATYANSTFASASYANTIIFAQANAAFAKANIANANFTAANILSLIETVDGSGSGLDADLLDSHDSTYFMKQNPNSGPDILQWTATSNNAPPSVGVRSIGTREVYYPSLSSTATDFAVGIDSGTLWWSLNASTSSYKWYANTTVVGTLSGTGNFTVPGSFISQVATGTAPFTVTSTTAVTNLNADMTDGHHTDTAFNSFGNSTIPIRNSSGNLYSNYFNTTADVQTASPSHMAIQVSSDNFIRWQTPAQFITNFSLAKLNTNQDWTGQQYFHAGQGAGAVIGTATGGLGGAWFYNNAGGTSAGFAAFHNGTFATYLGLDTDNVMKIGGWSMGAVAYAIHHDGNIGVRTAWPSNPVIVPASGSITTQTPVAYYCKLGPNVVFIYFEITINTVGTASGASISSISNLPFTASSSVAAVQTIFGRESASSGTTLQGVIFSGGTTIAAVVKYDNTGVALATGQRYSFCGTYMI